MCYFMPNFQTPPNILKEGEGGVMGMNRGGKGKKSGGTGGRESIKIVATQLKIPD